MVISGEHTGLFLESKGGNSLGKQKKGDAPRKHKGNVPKGR